MVLRLSEGLGRTARDLQEFCPGRLNRLAPSAWKIRPTECSHSSEDLWLRILALCECLGNLSDRLQVCSANCCVLVQRLRMLSERGEQCPESQQDRIWALHNSLPRFSPTVILGVRIVCEVQIALDICIEDAPMNTVGKQDLDSLRRHGYSCGAGVRWCVFCAA